MAARRNRYSLYDRKTDTPILVYATSDECAARMGISRRTFFQYLWRQENGVHAHKKFEVYRDEEDEDG